MTQPVTFGSASGVLAVPAGNHKVPAVVLIQEYWGINENIKDKADKWASEGFLALAPDLYHGKLAKNAAEAGQLMGALDWGKAAAEIGAAVEYVRGHERSTGKVALTGYCMGGALSFACAAQIKGLSAVVPFYGVPPGADWSKVTAPVQAHFATIDEWATVPKAKEIQAALGGKMELFVYEAQHAFCNEKRPEVYNAEAARQAWDRAVTFVRQHTA